MKERPILFNGEMVRAIIDGRKTQTRRVIKLPYTVPEGWYPDRYNKEPNWTFWGPRKSADSGKCMLPTFTCPQGEPGDRLYVRETWRVGTPSDDKKPKAILPPLVARGKGITVLYEAGGWKSVGPEGRPEPAYPDDEPMPTWAGKCRPSIHMPREFSRILLEIESVRVERVQEITADDCRAEGTEDDKNDGLVRLRFAQLWTGINEKRGFAWHVNPWVWAITFRRVK